MLIVDANVLIYAVNRRSPDHGRAKRWLSSALIGGESVGFGWTVLLAFLRITTLPGALSKPLPIGAASAVVESWLSTPPAMIVEPTARHLALVVELLENAGTGGNLVADAHLAALALEHDATVVSFDRDFARFEGVRLLRPV